MRDLLWIRYSILLIFFVLSLIWGDVENYKQFTAAFLAFLALSQVRERWLPLSARWLGIGAELYGCYWFGQSFGGFWYLVPFSIAVSLFSTSVAPSREGERVVRMFGVGAGILPFLLLNPIDNTAHVVSLVMLYFGFAGLLVKVHTLSEKNRETAYLFDEVRRKAYELEEARTQAADFARKIENAAQLEERNRIAIELHDDLGHRLIRAKLMLEAAVNVHAAQPDKSFELMAAVKEQLSESMETMRLTVRKWKPDRSVGHRQFSIHRLMEEASALFGIGITGDIRGVPYPLYPSAEVALYRNAQEAVTNAIRHGGATGARITLHYLPDAVRMTVTNNGSVPERGKVEKFGLGITAMRERAALLGGTVEIEIGSEFQIITTLPHVGNELIGGQDAG